MSRQNSYAKWNFRLSVIGFIGSLGFYFSVLREVIGNKPEQQKIEQLQQENKTLKKQLNECPKSTITFDMEDQSNNESRFIQYLSSELQRGQAFKRLQVEKAAGRFGIEDKTLIKELSEYAVVDTARRIANWNGIPKEKYNRIVDLYKRQANQSYRTSQSIMLRQYSTPAPIGYVMGLYCGIDNGRKTVFEPSAGNGLLTIAGTPQLTTVNEIDSVRRSNLERQPFFRVTSQDASLPFADYSKSFDAVITNPPFGSLGRNKNVKIEGFQIRDMDHYMAILALDTMKNNGKAAIIIGGHSSFDDKGRIASPKDRIFFNYLNHYYHVDDVILIDGKKLYSRQGTAFNTRLILISGRKQRPEGYTPLADDSARQMVSSFDDLFKRVMEHKELKPMDSLRLKAIQLRKLMDGNTLEGPYHPSSQGKSLQINVPDSMDFEIHDAVNRIANSVGGDMDNFVRHRLGYPTKQALYNALSAEQIDAVGMAIYNIEALGQGIIIGDQTGIGKGRSAAAIIRYASHAGLKPIFITEKANLFSDIYRDLSAIGSQHLKPFIVNNRESKTDIKDEDGLVIYQAPLAIDQNRILEKADLSGYDYVVATYTQFNSADKKPLKPNFLKQVTEGSIIILDESHNASGSSKTGLFMQGIVRKAKGAVFLSATFAKRPDNMPIYAMKTVISEASMSQEDLVNAITHGGVALQEVLASQLVLEGQMIRRERTYEGVEVNYISLDEYAESHKAIADNITMILRDIISFQNTYVDTRVNELDEIMAEEGAEAGLRKGTESGGVDNMPYFSKVFNVINQMLFSIKAEAVAERAIVRLKEGRKPVIAFSSTMGSFLEQMEDDNGFVVKLGDSINTDFSIVLEKGLEGVLRYTVTLPNGGKEKKVFDIDDLGVDAKKEYGRIREEISLISTGITISPIDVIVERIRAAGYKVAEVTGRKLQVQFNEKRNRGIVEVRKRVNTNDAFRQFNNNEIDVLLINQSGSTGASAHAISTAKVPESEVKQRVMIVVQPELDINTEIQKRGRINRTGQLIKPIYDYLNSAIPAELRLMMMLQKKLKSLDANTSSNQKQSSSILEVPDFLNKYGDGIVYAYLSENYELNEQLGNPLKLGSDESSNEDAALKVSGRVAVLSVKGQESFYEIIKERYETLVGYLKQTGEYDLEVEEMNLKAETKMETAVKIGKGGFSSFGEDSILEKIEANILRKPYKVEELRNMIYQTLDGKSADELKAQLLETYHNHRGAILTAEKEAVANKYTQLIRDVPQERKIKKLKKESPTLVDPAVEQRILELNIERSRKIEEVDRQAEAKRRFVEDLFQFFTVGKELIYQEPSFEGHPIDTMTVFLGFKIDYKLANPYAPSSIRLRFALASSQKYLEIPASVTDKINAIKGASIGIRESSFDELLNDWQQAIGQNLKDRGIRYVVTGNILQAFSSFSGKLVSYTTLDGQTRKGILMPEHWNAEKVLGNRIEVPVGMAILFFKSLPSGSDLITNNGIGFFKESSGKYRVIVPSSLNDGGRIFLNSELLKIVEGNNFEKVGKNMTAKLSSESIEPFVKELDELGITINLDKDQAEKVGLVKPEPKPRVKLETPPSESADEQLRLMKLRAKALKLKLRLLSFNKKAS
nr:strawberry notch family protein [uncultured Fluviicola sp.]